VRRNTLNANPTILERRTYHVYKHRTGVRQNFQSDVHLQYQRMGSKLRNTLRVKNSVLGSSTIFQKVGKGTASTKARHGKVPVMNVDHTPV